MNYLFIDLDCTLIDTKELVVSGGPEPTPGTPEHTVWQNHVTQPHVIAKAPAVLPVLKLIQEIDNSEIPYKIIFLTNRREKMRPLTTHWLFDRGLAHLDLIMRPDDCLTRAGEFKATMIENIIKKGDSVIIIDDDPCGSLESEFKKRPGWVHLKITTY